MAELEGDDTNGGDCLYEIKVPSSLVSTYTAGAGSKEKGGNCASVGHTYAFGSTEEKYRVLSLGCKERGRQRDGPLNHETGRGWVKQVKGHYHDALYVKKSRVVVWLVKTTGGVCPHATRTAAAWPSASAPRAGQTVPNMAVPARARARTMLSLIHI